MYSWPLPCVTLKNFNFQRNFMDKNEQKDPPVNVILVSRWRIHFQLGLARKNFVSHFCEIFAKIYFCFSHTPGTTILENFRKNFLEVENFEFYRLSLFWNVELIAGNYYYFGNCFFWQEVTDIATYHPRQKFMRKWKFFCEFCKNYHESRKNFPKNFL